MHSIVMSTFEVRYVYGFHRDDKLSPYLLFVARSSVRFGIIHPPRYLKGLIFYITVSPSTIELGSSLTLVMNSVLLNAILDDVE